MDLYEKINVVCGDFLDMKISLPKNCKVITNPPYSKFKTIRDGWEKTDVIKDSKELYSAFIEKIFNSAMSAVIISPFSFIAGEKFYSLRKLMCEKGNGSIVSFDNVPGNIFIGRKYGTFNSNVGNSVRAAVTTFIASNNKKGFKVSPLIRFKNEERRDLLNCKVLNTLFPSSYQVVNDENKHFKKIDKSLVKLFDAWISKSKFSVSTLCCADKSTPSFSLANTCRYFTTAYVKELSRTGKITLYPLDEDAFNFLYCFICSSFTYWWWRIFDGGITYPVSLLNRMPVPYNLLTEDDKKFFKSTTQHLISMEVTKMNAGSVQENIKIPSKIREDINIRLLEILDRKEDLSSLQKIHNNRFFENEK